MTTVTFRSEGSRLTGLEMKGHSGYAPQGEDIVCAALSSVVQTAVLGLMQIVGINVKLERDEKRGYLNMILPELDEASRHDADIILGTMLCGISDLHEGFSKYIKLECL